jgi:hypothetical protein
MGLGYVTNLQDLRRITKFLEYGSFHWFPDQAASCPGALVFGGWSMAD